MQYIAHIFVAYSMETCLALAKNHSFLCIHAINTVPDVLNGVICSMSVCGVDIYVTI